MTNYLAPLPKFTQKTHFLIKEIYQMGFHEAMSYNEEEAIAYPLQYHWQFFSKQDRHQLFLFFFGTYSPSNPNFTLLSKYKYIDIRGVGISSVVFKMQDRETGEYVAIKLYYNNLDTFNELFDLPSYEQMFKLRKKQENKYILEAYAKGNTTSMRGFGYQFIVVRNINSEFFFHWQGINLLKQTPYNPTTLFNLFIELLETLKYLWTNKLIPFDGQFAIEEIVKDTPQIVLFDLDFVRTHSYDFSNANQTASGLEIKAKDNTWNNFRLDWTRISLMIMHAIIDKAQLEGFDDIQHWAEVEQKFKEFVESLSPAERELIKPMTLLLHSTKYFLEGNKNSSLASFNQFVQIFGEKFSFILESSDYNRNSQSYIWLVKYFDKINEQIDKSSFEAAQKAA